MAMHKHARCCSTVGSRRSTRGSTRRKQQTLRKHQQPTRRRPNLSCGSTCSLSTCEKGHGRGSRSFRSPAPHPISALRDFSRFLEGENSLRKKGVGGKRRNGKQRAEGWVGGKGRLGSVRGGGTCARAHVRAMPSSSPVCRSRSPLPPDFLAFHRLLSSLESFHLRKSTKC